MKRTCHFVNAARGQVVDTDALFEALEQGRIAYAALDTTDPEPLPGDHKLLALPNVLITPHLGSATTETRTPWQCSPSIICWPVCNERRCPRA